MNIELEMTIPAASGMYRPTHPINSANVINLPCLLNSFGLTAQQMIHSYQAPHKNLPSPQIRPLTKRAPTESITIHLIRRVDVTLCLLRRTLFFLLYFLVRNCVL